MARIDDRLDDLDRKGDLAFHEGVVEGDLRDRGGRGGGGGAGGAGRREGDKDANSKGVGSDVGIIQDCHCSSAGRLLDSLLTQRQYG